MGMQDGDTGEAEAMLAICVLTLRYGALLTGKAAIALIELDPANGTLYVSGISALT